MVLREDREFHNEMKKLIAYMKRRFTPKIEDDLLEDLANKDLVIKRTPIEDS